MAFCAKCGAAVADGAGFCPACGAAQAAPGAVHSSPPASVPAASQMDEKVAGLLCYVLGWITGVIFYFIDKRPFVRFHAAQSIVVFVGIHIIYFVIGAIFGFTLFAGGLGGFSMAFVLYPLMGLLSFGLWLLLMIKAYQGERFRIPIAADIAEKIFGVA